MGQVVNVNLSMEVLTVEDGMVTGWFETKDFQIIEVTIPIESIVK